MSKHAGHIAHAGIVDKQLQADGFDVTLAPADVTLRSEVRSCRFFNDLALQRCAARHHHAQHVTKLNGIRLRFR